MDQDVATDTVVTLDAVVTFTVSTPLFNGLDPAERAEVARIMEVQRRTVGEAVFHEGEPGDAWYVVFEGRARVLKMTRGGEREIAVLERGACFGEIAILDGETRSATVRADGPLTVFCFRRARFQQLLDQGSLGAYKLVLEIARMLAQRHRRLTHQVAELSAKSGPGGQASQYQTSE